MQSCFARIPPYPAEIVGRVGACKYDAVRSFGHYEQKGRWSKKNCFVGLAVVLEIPPIQWMFPLGSRGMGGGLSHSQAFDPPPLNALLS